MREQADDTQLLVSKEAKLTYRDLVKPTVAQLTFSNGELRGTVVPLIESEYLVGRRSENNIAINDLGVSGFHARIFRGPDGYVVEDLKSRNGTWVNGGVVYHALLKDGDALRFGATEFKYELLATGS
jgi:pSer/pThr/pTyr-binding forkhead associated (FHA) protein